MSLTPDNISSREHSDARNVRNGVDTTVDATVPAPMRSHSQQAAGFSDLPATTGAVRSLVFRKNQALMTWGEKTAFRTAFDALVDRGGIGERIKEYREHNQMHRKDRFLPWHRLFLKQLEHDLQQINQKVTIPYWTWSTNRSVPDWVENWKPEISSLENSEVVQVTRTETQLEDELPTQSQIDAIHTRTSFQEFSREDSGGLESCHAAVLVAIGGTMDSVFSAPADPLFWMHLAELDRIWNDWQLTNPSGGASESDGASASEGASANGNPKLAEASHTLAPWGESELEAQSIRLLGYDYTI